METKYDARQLYKITLAVLFRSRAGQERFLQFREGMTELLNRLPERERLVLELRFGLFEGDGPRTLEAVGQTLGVTRERVRQLELRAFRRLRVKMPKIRSLL